MILIQSLQLLLLTPDQLTSWLIHKRYHKVNNASFTTFVMNTLLIYQLVNWLQLLQNLVIIYNTHYKMILMSLNYHKYLIWNHTTIEYFIKCNRILIWIFYQTRTFLQQSIKKVSMPWNDTKQVLSKLQDLYLTLWKTVLQIS